MSKIYIPPQPMMPLQKQSGKQTIKANGQQADFSSILNNEMEKSSIKFSAHAQKRIDSRNISLKQDDLAKLEQAVDKAMAKGSKESLVLIEKNAFVLSVPNRTVITAVDEASLKENVFTNIDSAIIM